MLRIPTGVTAPLVVAAMLAAAGCGRGAGDDPPPAGPPATTSPAVTSAPEADVHLDPVHEYPPVAGELTARQPLTVAVPETGDLTDRLAGDADLEVVIVLDFGDPAATPDFTVLVFVNTPDADRQTPTSAPGFIGTVAFLPGGDPDRSVRSVLPARDAADRTGGSEPLLVTLVPVPHPDRPSAEATHQVTVTATVVRTG